MGEGRPGWHASQPSACVPLAGRGGHGHPWNEVAFATEGRGGVTIRHFAHSLSGQPPELWQPLEEHLEEVARRAREFAERFNAAEWGYLAGLWHDVGKYSEAFQRYLRSAPGADYHLLEVEGEAAGAPPGPRIDHTSAGAQHAVEMIEILGLILAYPIAGHHAGLLDAIADGACMDRRLKKRVESWEQGLGRLPEARTPPPLPDFLRAALNNRRGDPQGAAFTFAFFTRMLFSCLVDADYLDTERFMDRKRADARPSWPSDILSRMEEALDAHVERLPAGNDLVTVKRREVREASLQAAGLQPGLFSLTVPTGGGKTLSSLAFALRHARKHGLERIVYVIPFTSIIEQNAGVFRKVMGSLVKAGITDPVLEHHSAVDAGQETLESRLATENWDAPLVVTTSVQFYESLFANRTSRCRKLHNLARSVIILDEAQKLPVDYLRPCLLALRELATNYGASVVLCTATQPAIGKREGFEIGLEGVREIMPNPKALYRSLKRVEVADLGRQTDDQLAKRLLDHDQVLCIVNTRRHARELFERLGDGDGVVHLSAAMCPEHRSDVLDRVRNRLAEGKPCRVISTQLVEAGVDVDFPVVYRSLAGLDSIAQAAGRCNRNGRLASAVTYVFRSDHQRSEMFLRDTANAASQILGRDGHEPLVDDLLSLEAIERYFRLYYWNQQERWDAKDIAGLFRFANDRALPFLFDYREAALRFKLIEDTGQGVVIPWGKQGAELVEELRRSWGLPDRSVLRALQRFTVQIPGRIYHRNLGKTFELVLDRYPVLIGPELYYDERLGLVLDRGEFEAGTFMI